MKVLVVQFRPFPPLLRHSQDQIFSTAPYSRTPSVHTLLSMQEAKFHTHIKKTKFAVEHAAKAQRGSRGIAYSFFNLGARFSWVVIATPRPLYRREVTGTHCTRGWVRPKAGLKGCG